MADNERVRSDLKPEVQKVSKPQAAKAAPKAEPASAPKVSRGSIREDRDDDARGALEDDREEVVLMDEDDDELIDQFINGFARDVLPMPKDTHEFHYCWLTTTNQRDPIHGRLRLGYKLVSKDEFPDLRGYHLMSGEYAGYIGLNEMVLGKLSQTRYQKIMRKFHHDDPRDEERAIKERVLALQADVNARRGAHVAHLIGMQNIERTERAPVFE